MQLHSLTHQYDAKGALSSESDAIATRLQQLASMWGLTSQAAFGEALGISRPYAAELLAGRKGLGEQALVALAARGVNLSWVLIGKGPVMQPGAEAGQNAVVEVPIRDALLSAGPGADAATGRAVGSKPFRESELKEISRQPQNLSIVQITGTSMEPLLHAGDEVMVDTTAPITLRDGLFALRIGDALLIKHVQRLPQNKIRIVSENPAYAPFEITLGDGPEDFDVIGRVVWGARRY